MSGLKRVMLAPLITLLVSTSLPAAPPSSTPRKVPLVETVHGIRLTDEYRWMEDPANKAEMLAFVRAESARTRAMLDALPEHAWFARRIAEVGSALDRVTGYTQCGDVALVRRQKPGEPTAKVYLRTKQGERLFVDPAVLTGADGASISTIAFSPDCTKVAINAAAGGAEIGKAYLLDVASGRPLRAPIERMWGEDAVQFGPDGTLIYPQLTDQPGDPMRGNTAWLGSLRGSSPIALLGNGKVVSPDDVAEVFISSISPFVIGMAAGARTDNEFWVAPMADVLGGKPRWAKAAALSDHVATAYVRGNAIFLQTARGNDAGQVVRHELNADGSMVPGAGEIIFAGSPDRLVKDISATRDGIYVMAAHDGASRLFFLPDGRGPAREIALPFEGTLYRSEADSDGRGLTFALTGWTENARVLRAENGVLIDTGLASQNWSGAKAFAPTRLEAVSADGTRVPMVVLRRAGTSGRAPTILDAYGGYGIDTVRPAYDRLGMAWLDKGGVFAFCGTRGGGERGRAWHDGGRGVNKPRAMEDLAACARTLTSAGIAPENGPLVTGGSMGGTLVPTAALRFPNAFGAMVTAVGIVNATRIAQAENGTNQFSEMGDPKDAKAFRGLLAMDAYQMLPKASRLPPTMMMIGLNDNRVSPWMTAKWFARARAKWPNGPLWLRADENAGHGIGSSERVRSSEEADLFAFAWDQQMRASPPNP